MWLYDTDNFEERQEVDKNVNKILIIYKQENRINRWAGSQDVFYDQIEWVENITNNINSSVCIYLILLIVFYPEYPIIIFLFMGKSEVPIDFANDICYS